MISWLCSLLVTISLIKADPVLRYNLSSCNTLEPVYVEENWQQGMMGGDQGDQEELFDIPRRSRQRNPPFEIQIDFDQYRRNRKYTGIDRIPIEMVFLIQYIFNLFNFQ